MLSAVKQLGKFATGTLYLGVAAALPMSAQADDLTYYLPPSEVVWLSADAAAVQTADAHDQATPQRILMLQRENEQAADRGHLLVVAELGTHPLQSSLLRHWYQGMPAYGWHTYAMQAPLLQINDVEWNAEIATRYSPANDIQFLLDAMRARLVLALQHIEQAEGTLILISEGVSGALITQLLHQGEFAQVDALVVVGSYFPQQQLNTTLTTQTAQLKLPVLDIIPARQQPWVAQQSKRRVQQSQRHQQPSFRQRVLVAQPVATQPRYLHHELYGWLRHLEDTLRTP